MLILFPVLPSRSGSFYLSLEVELCPLLYLLAILGSPGLMLRSLRHLELSITHGDRTGPGWYSWGWDTIFPKPFVEECCPFLKKNVYFWHLCQQSSDCWTSCGSSVLPHWSTCLCFVPIPRRLYYYRSVVSLKIRCCDSSPISFWFRIALVVFTKSKFHQVITLSKSQVVNSENQ